jgi:Fe-S cluster assembly iron-binding protein IscA
MFQHLSTKIDRILQASAMNGHNTSSRKENNQTLSEAEYLRVEVNGGGCSGFTVGLSKTDGANENDIWLRQELGYRLHLGGVFIKGNSGLDR